MDGTVHQGRLEQTIGAHCSNHNANSIGVCYEGGLNAQGKPADTRAEAQKRAVLDLLLALKRKYPAASIYGHRDLSPDRNHDGVITADEYVKQCPCFDAQLEYHSL